MAESYPVPPIVMACLRILCLGSTQPDIAQSLGISPDTLDLILHGHETTRETAETVRLALQKVTIQPCGLRKQGQEQGIINCYSEQHYSRRKACKRCPFHLPAAGLEA